MENQTAQQTETGADGSNPKKDSTFIRNLIIGKVIFLVFAAIAGWYMFQTI